MTIKQVLKLKLAAFTIENNYMLDHNCSRNVWIIWMRKHAETKWNKMVTAYKIEELKNIKNHAYNRSHWACNT